MKTRNSGMVGGIVMVAFLLIFAVSAQAFEIGARGYYWFPDFSASLRVDKNSTVGTTIDAENDLGMGDESYPSVEVFGGLGNHHFSLMYTKADYSGAKNLDKSIIFNGRTYSLSTYVESDLELTMIDAEYQYDLIDLENVLAGFSLGIIGKIKYLEGDARIKGGGFDESESFKAPIPMIGVGAHIGILADILEARAKIAGIGYSGSKFYEGQADISVTPFPFLDIHAGYKFMKLDVDDVSDVYADVEFKGPYVGLTVSF
jgi:outer membrane protein